MDHGRPVGSAGIPQHLSRSRLTLGQGLHGPQSPLRALGTPGLSPSQRGPRGHLKPGPFPGAVGPAVELGPVWGNFTLSCSGGTFLIPVSSARGRAGSLAASPRFCHTWQVLPCERGSSVLAPQPGGSWDKPGRAPGLAAPGRGRRASSGRTVCPVGSQRLPKRHPAMESEQGLGSGVEGLGPRLGPGPCCFGLHF